MLSVACVLSKLSPRCVRSLPLIVVPACPPMPAIPRAQVRLNRAQTVLGSGFHRPSSLAVCRSGNVFVSAGSEQLA
jgi:hypothetical protein